MNKTNIPLSYFAKKRKTKQSSGHEQLNIARLVIANAIRKKS